MRELPAANVPPPPTVPSALGEALTAGAAAGKARNVYHKVEVEDESRRRTGGAAMEQTVASTTRTGAGLSSVAR